MRIFKAKRTFKKEFKRQIKYAIAAAVGFLIAFAWRDSIYLSVSKLVETFEKTTQAASNMLTAILITIIGVLIILVSSRLLRDK